MMKFMKSKQQPCTKFKKARHSTQDSFTYRYDNWGTKGTLTVMKDSPSFQIITHEQTSDHFQFQFDKLSSSLNFCYCH